MRFESSGTGPEDAQRGCCMTVCLNRGLHLEFFEAMNCQKNAAHTLNDNRNHSTVSHSSILSQPCYLNPTEVDKQTCQLIPQ